MNSHIPIYCFSLEREICSGCTCWYLQKLFIALTWDLVVNLKHGGNDSPPSQNLSCPLKMWVGTLT